MLQCEVIVKVLAAVVMVVSCDGYGKIERTCCDW